MNTDNLKAARKKSGKTQKEVAEGIGIGQGTYKNYETGAREPNGETLVAIANYFDVSTDYLLGRPTAQPPKDPIADFVGRTKMPGNEKAALAKWLALDSTKRQAVLDIMAEIVREYESAEERNKKPPVFVIRRHVNRASAGAGYDLDNSDNWESIAVLDCPEAHEADFTVEVDGNSMAPSYEDGDVVYVVLDPNVPLGKVGLFRMGGKGYIKRCGKDRLISDNPEYDDIYPDSWEDIECIGRVIGIAETVE